MLWHESHKTHFFVIPLQRTLAASTVRPQIERNRCHELIDAYRDMQYANQHIMNKKHFADLLAGIKQMDNHMRGKRVRGARVTRVEDIDPAKIRTAAGLSQSEFARLISVPLKTLQNWEQKRTQPAGPARALLKIVAADPKAAIKALHSA